MQNDSPLCLALLCLLDCLRRSGPLRPVGLIHPTKPLDWVAHIFRTVTCFKRLYLIPPLLCTALPCTARSVLRAPVGFTRLCPKKPLAASWFAALSWPLPRLERLLL
ncbi:hypothetical protein CGRA01v4_00792 [Colletotrichum graminicola]|nr:hypothetical protein CGRA01v4_00792 [Colletotrichum graminicola]